jgi:hypothetical protein
MIELKLTVKSVKVDKAAATLTARDHGTVRVLEYCQKTMNQAILDCPVDTGRLRAGHRMTLRATGKIVTGTVSNPVKYAAAVHDGSSRHRRRRPRPWLANAGKSVAVSTGFLWAPTRG